MLNTLEEGAFCGCSTFRRGLCVSCRHHGIVREPFFAALRGKTAADQLGYPDVSISEYGWEIKTGELELALMVVRQDHSFQLMYSVDAVVLNALGMQGSKL